MDKRSYFNWSEINLCFWRSFLSFSCFLPAIVLQIIPNVIATAVANSLCYWNKKLYC
ncbi:hypothetical protein Nmel_006952, partial [Mimus melanotis]